MDLAAAATDRLNDQRIGAAGQIPRLQPQGRPWAQASEQKALPPRITALAMSISQRQSALHWHLIKTAVMALTAIDVFGLCRRHDVPQR